MLRAPVCKHEMGLLEQKAMTWRPSLVRALDSFGTKSRWEGTIDLLQWIYKKDMDRPTPAELSIDEASLDPIADNAVH